MLASLVLTALLASDNTLTAKEAKQGWMLLFDGKSTAGWHNYAAEGIRAGWQVKDGVLTVADPENAGDIVTDGKFDWFELQVDFNYEPGQNSGIIFHIADDGQTMWHSGPEVQIYDHKMQAGEQITGDLYQLYQTKVDASKPAGQWNHLDIYVSQKKCWTKVNGAKYYEYVYGSPDFWARVAKSKFHEFPEFAKTIKGAIGIQGDHGKVSFKNIKIRPLKV